MIVSAATILFIFLYQVIKKCIKPEGDAGNKIVQNLSDDEEPETLKPANESASESERETSPFAKFCLSDEAMSNLVVAHEAQIERLVSGKYFVATA